MKKLQYLLLIIFVTCYVAITPLQAKEDNINYVTAEIIINSLPKSPINVGFDIDDTILFSSPCFHKLSKDFAKEHNIQFQSEEALWYQIKDNQDFWNKIATCDSYSLPKKSVINILRMHQRRGDNIFFITARTAPETKYTDFLNNYLIEIIGNANKLHPVMYSINKVAPIKNNNITLYYGDSDTDIEDALKAGAKPIRILRSSNSTLKVGYNLGKYQESVLNHSDN
ncbi:Class B acid phosphatase [Candidatus Hepatincola sp. Av]